MPMGVKARIWKTQLLHSDRARFLEFLRYDIGRLIRRARKLGLTPAVRLNGTSDLPWLSLQMSQEFPDVQFYDYTKLPKAYLRTRANYAITFSYSGHNLAETMDALARGVNVAVVFDCAYRKLDVSQHQQLAWIAVTTLQGRRRIQNVSRNVDVNC
jgi:hypothetical protein